MNLKIQCRLFYAGACEGQMPEILTMIQVNRLTPTPAVLGIAMLSLFYLASDNIFSLINYVGFATWVRSEIALRNLLNYSSVALCTWVSHVYFHDDSWVLDWPSSAYRICVGNDPTWNAPFGSISSSLSFTFLLPFSSRSYPALLLQSTQVAYAFSYTCRICIWCEDFTPYTGYGALIIFTGVPVYLVFIYWKNKPPCIRKALCKYLAVLYLIIKPTIYLFSWNFRMPV